MTGVGWISWAGAPRKVTDKVYHREYSLADGSTVVRTGKKRTHKAFGPVEFTPSN